MIKLYRIKNSANKTVCYVDGNNKSVRISKKDQLTVITFNDDNTYDVKNSKLNKKSK